MHSACLRKLTTQQQEPFPNKGDDFRIPVNLADRGDEKLHRAFHLSQLNPWRRSTCAVFSASESDSAIGMLSFISPHAPPELEFKNMSMTVKKVLIMYLL